MLIAFGRYMVGQKAEKREILKEEISMKTNIFVCSSLLILFSSSNLYAASYGGGTGDANNPYQIWTPEQMNTIGLGPNDWNKCFKLMADINMSAYTGTQYNIIGNSTTAFSGSFDGNGHIISNLTYTTTASVNVGILGQSSNATIKNIGLENVNLSTEGNAGGVVGYNYNSVITNCYSMGSVASSYEAGGLVGYQLGGAITNCYSMSSVSGFAYAGGLVGWQKWSSIMNCYSTGSVVASYALPYYACAGGLVGYQFESGMKNCCNTGSVTSSSFSSSSWPSYSKSGGLVGSQYDSAITNCYNTGSVTSFSSSPPSTLPSSSYAGGLVGEIAGSGTRIEECYSTGHVSATGSTVYQGGLLGSGYSGATVAANFWDTQASGITDGVGNMDPDPNGVTGKPTEDMKILSTFISARWDFTNETTNGTGDIWRMCVDGVSYPRLSWEFSEYGDFMCPDGVDFQDFSILGKAWMSSTGGSGWNATCDISLPPDGKINTFDLITFAQNWLEGI
jgi:hypothetical protein